MARLHAETSFIDQLKQDFGSQAKVRFHLAPPIMSPELDARGRPRKRAFGGWMLPVFRLLARARRLRGTRFDPFGYTAERRMERELISEFEEHLDRLLERLDDGNVDDAAGIVSMYLKIRGYGPVKEEAAAKFRPQIAASVESFGASVERAA